MSFGNLSIASGYEEKFYATAETTFGTMVKPSGTDAIRIKKSVFTPSQERVNRADKRGSRSVQERITRKKKVEWSATAYLCPSGTAGTEPDDGALLEAVFGSKTESAGVSWTYSLALDIDKSFSLHRICGEYAESITGAVVNQVIFRVRGEEEAEIEYSGFASDFIFTSRGALAASAASGATSLTVTSDTLDNIEVNSVIKIGDDTNSGAGFKVSAINGTTVTIEDGLTDDADNGAVILPYFPDTTTAGSPLGCFPGTISIDGTNVYLTTLEITLSNNITMRNDEFGSSTARGYTSSDFRSVTISGTAYACQGYGLYRGKSRDFEDVDIQITLGDTAGSQVEINLDHVEFNIIPLEIPESNECTLTFEGQALASSSGEDEINVIYK